MTELPTPSSELLDALAAQANAAGFIELPDFIETALYHPQHGYYIKERQRVGRNPQSDFYTSVSLRAAFAEIIIEAACDRLRSLEIDPSDAHWVEIGAEPDSSLLSPEGHPFRSLATIGFGQPIEIPSPAVVFSNELFDAQSFRQVRVASGDWKEYGLRFEDRELRWQQRETLSDEATSYLRPLPDQRPEGYTIDLPTGANSLARSIVNQPWDGVFIAFDYGKTWQSLLHDTPQGSCRGYFRHQIIPDILQSPGCIDITHHICWDDLESALKQSGFVDLSLQSQESFIIRRAPSFLQKVFDPSRSSLDPIRRKLKELTHPSLMGQKFQALSATRLSTPRA
ncbi:SAM-dependent methyltransferase [Pelagicoccus sp. SDUM812003]|uniref:SAM-dependent methyltransferase n=1 Tax=Pelagicoccus sp. SDUM812003 TaxID=3041267 RepID=UPI00280D5C4F|nr:SAM-dependent methyltransferase [Pelagicoccus sp. SDUM812003]MDQ8203942.1 SAM-dependent methyltransferase [Pelagicoccus sp. SDUM812003]